jgi:hypothetical protein
VLGLGKEIGGDPVGIRIAVSEDQNLRGPGDHVDPDLSEDPALRRSDIGIPGPDDLGDRRDRLRSVGQSRHRLRTADAKKLVDTGKSRGCEHERIGLAPRRRDHHHDPRHARDLRGHRIHQDR